MDSFEATGCLRSTKDRYLIKVANYHFSPCSGFVDTSFVFNSNVDDTYLKNLGRSFMQYKSFKKMYVLDETSDMFRRKRNPFFLAAKKQL